MLSALQRALQSGTGLRYGWEMAFNQFSLWVSFPHVPAAAFSSAPITDPHSPGQASCTVCTSLLSSSPILKQSWLLLLWGQALNESCTAVGQALSMPCCGAAARTSFLLLLFPRTDSSSSSSCRQSREGHGLEGLSCSTGFSRAVGTSAGVLCHCGKPQ